MSSVAKHKARSSRSSHTQKGYYAMNNKNYPKHMFKALNKKEKTTNG